MQLIGAITFLLQLKCSTSLELISQGKLNFAVWAYFNQNNWAGISMNQCWLTYSNWCLSLSNFSSWILDSFAHQGAIPVILYFKYFKLHLLTKQLLINQLWQHCWGGRANIHSDCSISSLCTSRMYYQKYREIPIYVFCPHLFSCLYLLSLSITTLLEIFDC